MTSAGAAQLKALLNLSDARARPHAVSTPVEQRAVDDFVAVPPTSSDEDLAADQDGCVLSTGTIDSSGLSYDRLNSTWDECKSATARRYSPEDTSGVQTADCSLDTQNDTPMRLYDELAIASRYRTVHLVNDRAISEAASILESIQNDPETILLEEEDRFSTSMSSHDRLTRLALTIETDAEMPVILDDPNNNNCLRRLHDKIERLQYANKEIHRDIRSLRANFQCDERRMSDLSSATAKLRQDVNELRYLDDLLKLLQGELERISARNWPFVLGHSEPHEELNLII